MNILEVFRFSFEALWERRVRATLTTLMVIMGASLIVALNGTGNGFTSFINNQFSNLGANVLIISPRGDIDINDALIDEISRINGVEEAVPFFQQTSSITSKGESQTSIVVGMDQSKLPLLFPTISFQSGTYVPETDSVGIILGNELIRSSSGKEIFASLGQTRERAASESFDGISSEDLIALDEHAMLTLIGAVQALRFHKTPYVSIKDAYEYYLIACEGREIQLFTYSKIRDYIKDLHFRGLLNYNPRKGISIVGASVEDLSRVLQTIERSRELEEYEEET